MKKRRDEMKMPRNSPDITCCFSGYRPSKLPWGTNERDPWCMLLKKRLYDVAEALYVSGIRHYICGMAQGSDMYFCEAVFKLRSEKGDITVEAAIPCEGQADSWDEESRNRYFKMVSECDYETLVNLKYTKDCMLERNNYMVDNSSVLVTVFDGKFGGTMHTVNYARKKGLEIIKIKP